jgi:hypothetical protein
MSSCHRPLHPQLMMAHPSPNANLILGGELDPVRFALPLLVDCLLTVLREQSAIGGASPPTRVRVSDRVCRGQLMARPIPTANLILGGPGAASLRFAVACGLPADSPQGAVQRS